MKPFSHLSLIPHLSHLLPKHNPLKRKKRKKTLRSPIISNLINPINTFLFLISQHLSAISIQNSSSFHHFETLPFLSFTNTTHPWFPPSLLPFFHCRLSSPTWIHYRFLRAKPCYFQFSIYTLFLDKLIHSLSFNTDNKPKFVSPVPTFTVNYRFTFLNCQPDISKWVSHWQLKLDQMSKTELLILSLCPQNYFIYSFYKYLLSICSGPVLHTLAQYELVGDR